MIDFKKMRVPKGLFPVFERSRDPFFLDIIKNILKFLNIPFYDTCCSTDNMHPVRENNGALEFFNGTTWEQLLVEGGSELVYTTTSSNSDFTINIPQGNMLYKMIIYITGSPTDITIGTTFSGDEIMSSMTITSAEEGMIIDPNIVARTTSRTIYITNSTPSNVTILYYLKSL